MQAALLQSLISQLGQASRTQKEFLYVSMVKLQVKMVTSVFSHPICEYFDSLTFAYCLVYDLVDV